MLFLNFLEVPRPANAVGVNATRHYYNAGSWRDYYYLLKLNIQRARTSVRCC